MRVGIFGGSFNPPHLGHLLASREAAKDLGLDLLYVVPTGTPPHKRLPDGAPDAETRLHLTELLFAQEPGVVVTDLELRRPGPSYTVDTVLAIKRQHPDAALYLLMGTDMYDTLAQWHRAEELGTLMTPYVFHRLFALSSTKVRALLAERQGADFVGDAVYRDIIAHGYYGAKPDFAWLLEQVAQANPRRAAHTKGTEEAAIALAARWGVDVAQAREAAILHDITKGLNRDAQLRLCEKYGMMPDDVERENPKLLHAMTGAAVARAAYGVCDAVFDAILCHTTGRAEMTPLDKVLYMADYIEPSRDFDELPALRELAYTDLEAAVRYGLELTDRELREKGVTQHPRSVEAMEWYQKRGLKI